MSGNLSQIMKLWVKLKSAICMCSAVIPKAVMGEPSTVFSLAVVGCICVLKLLSICWYGEYHISEIAAPESINALYCFLACTVMVGQSVMCAL